MSFRAVPGSPLYFINSYQPRGAEVLAWLPPRQMSNETSSLRPPSYQAIPTQEDSTGENNHRDHAVLESRAGDATSFKTALVRIYGHIHHDGHMYSTHMPILSC
jgi:hypothetical protein